MHRRTLHPFRNPSAPGAAPGTPERSARAAKSRGGAGAGTATRTAAFVLTAAGLLAAAAVGPPAIAGEIVERDTLRRSLRFEAPAGERRAVVENVVGPVTVTGHDGPALELVARRTIRAETRSRLERALAEVVLEIREEGDRVVVAVEGPERDRDRDSRHRGSHGRGWDREGYDVEYDLEIRLPEGTDLTLRTVDGGHIRVRGVRGDFDVANVNGDILMSGIEGSGRATTVNGDIEIGFAANPAGPSAFNTVNGSIEVAFPTTPSAELRISTMNGEAYADFDVEAVNRPAAAGRRRGGKKVYGGGDSFLVRSGAGGPEHSFSTINGNIYLTRTGESR